MNRHGRALPGREGAVALAWLLALVAGGGCAVHPAVVEPIEAVQAQAEIPEDGLLDVGIQVFEPGLPDLPEKILEEQGVFPDVRRSEGRFMAVHLMRTLQSTGQWGAVRVLPTDKGRADVTKRGEILSSDGKDLALRIRVVDAAGRQWLDKTYEEPADRLAYLEERSQSRDPFQNIYNRIANDILEARQKLSPEECRRIRAVAELRFAADLAPAAFSDYLDHGDDGRYDIERLPSAGDPMVERVSRIRERDYAFIDTLNEQYADFYARMAQPYDDWRAYSFEEQLAYDEIRRESTWKKVGGILGMLAGIVISEKDERGDNPVAQVASQAAMIGGWALLNSGLRMGEEAKIHVAALQELAASFDAEMSPLLVEVEGQTMQLTGSAEGQFASWRKMLHDLFTSETGLPVDPNQPVEPSGARED